MNAMQRAVQLNLATQYRRERGGVSTVPPSGAEDYGSVMTDVNTALLHLTEGLPAGQQNRVVNAALALQAGVAALLQYLDAAGYFSSPEVPQAEYTLEADAVAAARTAQHEFTMRQFKQ